MSSDMKNLIECVLAIITFLIAGILSLFLLVVIGFLAIPILSGIFGFGFYVAKNILNFLSYF